ncbi:MAG: DUF3732 domain-containing protein [Calditrichaceae bacterium]|nr:DUF3732 domain-containing protein [Calditrichaceae bacterium]MBN2708619.1 DUF3732 domain-containing protein [Calditrichaceae bacterium]RQV95469.1 MAG: DUF3732 domain-containing protein [Calditrichota bacterium]
MNLQILKLVIWPKTTEFAPRIVEFKPGVLNVITGASRTGKSAIIPIIDYCLASSDCFIPIDTIRDHASWYGVLFQTDSEEILLARSIPIGTKVSNDFYVLRAQIVSIPPAIDKPNENIDGVKNILNTLASVPYFGLNENNDKVPYQARLGFRDLMALVFQNQDIVANQNILFYKTHAHAHRERLRNWFPFILGAENIEILKARQRLQEIEHRLRQLRREFEKAKLHSSSWMNNMVGHLKVASEYGLLDKEVTQESTPEYLLNIAKQVIENIPEYTRTKSDDVHTASKELTAYEIEEDKISSEIGLVKKRLNELQRLKSGFNDYGNAIRKRVERLHISQWLMDISSEAQSCPTCGSSEHPNSASEIQKISEAFKIHENLSKSVEEIPTSFSREEERLKLELDSLLKVQKEHQQRYDILIARDKKSQEEFQRRKNMFLFLGHLKASTETFESLGDGGEFQEEISQLEKEFNLLSEIADRSGVQKRVKAIASKISQSILNHLKTLDVEDKYREIAPKFDVEDLNISVLSTDGNWHYLAEVGSASNWVSFHLALFCSLQEYFVEQKISSVPNFVIFDQPSQVYFPKVNQGGNADFEDPKYEDEDVRAVKQIFKTVANSIISKNGEWQGIILDHADISIYGEIEGLFEVEVWREGIKLIPEEWYM